MKKSDMTFVLISLNRFHVQNSQFLVLLKKRDCRITFWRWVRIFEETEISAYMKEQVSQSPSDESSSILPYRTFYVQSLKVLKCVRTPSIR